MHYTHFSDEETEERIRGLPKATRLTAAEPRGWLAWPPSILKPKPSLWFLPLVVQGVGVALGGSVP